MPVVSISMSEGLLEELDEFIDDSGYSGRSEAVREGTRELMAEECGDCLDDGVCLVVASFVHDADTEVALSELCHDHSELVSANVHSHAGGECLELFVLDGGADAIGSFLAQVRAVEGVRTVEYTGLTMQDVRTPAT